MAIKLNNVDRESHRNNYSNNPRL